MMEIGDMIFRLIDTNISFIATLCLPLIINKGEMKHFSWSDMLLGVRFVKEYTCYGCFIIYHFHNYSFVNV